MKKYVSVTIFVLLFMLTGCSKTQANVVYDSSMLDNAVLVEELKQGDALLAVIISEENNQIKQQVYIWNNQLRRDLRTDLISIYTLIDLEKSNQGTFTTDIEFSTSVNLTLSLNGKTLDFSATSVTTKLVIALLFPESFIINSNDFKTQLMHMIIRLETLEIHGDTEVIILEVTTNEPLLLGTLDKDTIHHFADVQALIDTIHD